MEESREKKALALLDYTESKQELAVLRDKIADIGRFFKAVGDDLIAAPSTYAYKKYTITPQIEIDVLVQDFDLLYEKTERLRQKAASFGLAV